VAITPAGASVPVLAWQPCADPDQSGFDCATAQVPLDYRDPRGVAIDLAVIKHPATDPAHRIGSLFFNPGGPGGIGTQDLPKWFDLFPATLRERLDIISWDPRGLGASTAVQCFATAEDEQNFFAGIPSDFFPVGSAEKHAWIRRYAQFGQLCEQRNRNLLAHVSTAESAKDLDLLCQAVNAPQLNYLGVSYGTFLGATYANLFPTKVRAMVLDGNVDPVAWTNGGREGTFLSTSLRLGSDKASAETLNASLDLCGQAEPDQCAFSPGNAAATRAKFATLLQRLQEQPVTVDTTTITYTVLVSAMKGYLTTTQEQPGASWLATAADRYSGPWDQLTANPILVLGNTYNPATPYQGAVAMARYLGRARLLTVDGYGHTAILNPSTCVNDYESGYFVAGTLSPTGTVCQQDQPPFGLNLAKPENSAK
jgi:pimeloyl-ACP methyl ester carboxylesterase